METEQLIPPLQQTYLYFRLTREPRNATRLTEFILTVFKISFCSLGLWGHQSWNYIPRILFMVVCVYQVVYQLHIDFTGCPNFDCRRFMQNLTDNDTLRKDDVATGNALFSIVSLAAVISYLIFIGCFFVARRKDSALVSPSESMMVDINKTDAILLFLAFVFVIATFMGLGASFYKIPATNQIRDPFTIAVVTGTGAQFLVHWASINTCHVFAVSSSTIGTFAQDALRRIQDVQIKTLDDVIRIHEDLCTVVFNTVSAYSVWFVLHWFTYGAGVVVAVIYTEEEVISRTKYHTQMPEFVFLGLLFVSVLYLFVFPCVCAARITSNCAGKITDAKNNTPH
ncbi:hypothetical protein OS493_020375 [Desmophyllum pertusum]|uniref:Uncharacterized protein n=1 Tax=Desmophyllum pertusum TaxID=174260 RepID=A0A9W9ZN63_9CNID|nr:hypothetical protein OS493_020375 [Desmophyllum pertusum]